MDEPKDKTGALRSLVVYSVVAVLVMVAVLGSGAVSFNAVAASSTTDVDIELVPKYREVTYVLDPIETLQRWDARGDWNLIGTPVIDDSLLMCEQNEGANLTHADWPAIDNGMYYEARMKADATTAAGGMRLDQFGSSDQILIGFNATGDIYCAYYTGSATKYKELGSYAANTFYRVGVLFETSQVTFYGYYDNYTATGSAAVTDCGLKYTDVDSIILNESAAGRVMYFDYVYQTSDRTPVTSTSATGTGVNAGPKETDRFMRMKVDFSDREMDPATYSDYSAVHSAVGKAVSTKSLNNDRYLNMADFGQVLASTKETDIPIIGTAKFQGWKDLRTDNERQLQEYLADKHNVGVDQIHVVDYYVTDLSLNYTWGKDVADKVQETWFDATRDLAEDLGADLVFKEGRDPALPDMPLSLGKTTFSAVLPKAADLENVYFPAAISQKSFETMMKDLSDRLREKTIGAALLVPENFANITDRAALGFSLQDAADMAILDNALKNLDQAFQFTDLALGEILNGTDYLDMDLSGVQSSVSGWSIFGDGKPESQPLSSVSVMGSTLVLIIVIVVIVVIACVATSFLLTKNRKGRREY